MDNFSESSDKIHEPNKAEENIDLMGFEDDAGKKSFFKLFGYEFVAPTGMKNPGVVYMLFVIVNLIIFLIFLSFRSSL